MSINIKTDLLRSAILFDRSVLFTSQRIPRVEVPEGWYYYELRGSVRNAKKPVALSDHAYVNPIGSVLSPVPLKRANTISRRVNGRFLLLGETMTLRDYCRSNSLEYPFHNQAFAVRPASREEAGLFYSEQDEAKDKDLGTVGHMRMDFDSSGKGFYHTWWPHNGDRFNTPEFQEALQQFVDAMRRSGPLKNLAAMGAYCRQQGGAVTEDDRSYGYITETENYRFCLRCTPLSGEYQGYLYCYDLRQQELYQQEHPVVGRITFASGEELEYRDKDEFVACIREELPSRPTTGFRWEVLTDDLEVDKQIDDLLYNLYGEDNPRRSCNYGMTEAGKRALRDAADPSRPHIYAWFVMTDTNTPQEKIRQELTLEEAIQIYQDTDASEKRLGVTKDSIATVDLVRSLDGEQSFFEDHKRLESFRSDPVVAKAAEQLHMELKRTMPQQGMTMGGIT